MDRKRLRGFSLIELMIVVVIIGIIAGIGYPSYQRYIVRASREAAKTELLQLAALQEKIYLNSTSYAVSVTASYNGRSDGGLGKTTGRTSDGKYTIAVSPTAGPTQTYTLTATPVAGMTQEGDGNISINSAGTRSGTGCCTTW